MRVDDRRGREVSAYLGLRAREVGGTAPTQTVVEGEVALGDHLRGPHGGVRAGALLALVDSVAGWCGGLAALPRGWVVSTSLLLRAVGGAERGPLRVDARALRAGRAAVVTEAVVTDTAPGAGPGAGSVVAEGVLTSAILVPEGGPPEWTRPASLDLPPAPADLPPIVEGFGIRAATGGGVELDVVDGLRNPWGIVHGGVTATLVDVAAERAAGLDDGGRVADVALHFLAPGRVGPIRAEGRVLGARPDGVVVRVEIADVGAGARRLAVAIATVVPIGEHDAGTAPDPSDAPHRP